MTVRDFHIQHKLDTGHYPPTHPHGDNSWSAMKKYVNYLEEKVVELLNQKGIVRAGGTSTCDHCADNNNCEFAFDPYNTDGDCLAIK